MKRAIVLDLDETLEHGISQSIYGIGNETIMILRPNLDVLITKLKEAKEQDVDIILCTTARDTWVNRFLTLKPEFKAIFDKRLTRDNEKEWLNFSKDKYPLEYKAKSENINLEYAKPITTFEYEQILFIDNSKIEELRLKMLFEMTKGRLDKDVTFFSSFGFYGGKIDYNELLGYKKCASYNQELSKKLKEYIELERNNIGCLMMCSAIDRFINKDFTAGLTLVDDDFTEQYKIFDNKTSMLKQELENLKVNLDRNLFNYDEKELKSFLNTDMEYVYEGLDI